MNVMVVDLVFSAVFFGGTFLGVKWLQFWKIVRGNSHLFSLFLL